MTLNCHVLLCMLTAKTWNTQQSPILARLQPIAQQGIDKSARIRQMPQALQGDPVPGRVIAWLYGGTLLSVGVELWSLSNSHRFNMSIE